MASFINQTRLGYVEITTSLQSQKPNTVSDSKVCFSPLLVLLHVGRGPLIIVVSWGPGLINGVGQSCKGN